MSGTSKPNQSQVVLHKIAAMLGSAREWDSAADYLEDIAATINESGVYPCPVSDQDDEALGYWRMVADEYGIGYDDDEDDDYRECSRCGDEVSYLSTDDLCDGCVEEDDE